MPDKKLDVASALLGSRLNRDYGLNPYDPQKNIPQDVGLGGLSTEYLATEYDPQGRAFNYPTIWWDSAGNPHLLSPDEAYEMALRYEGYTDNGFPRFDTIGAAVNAAENRSAQGGGDVSPLALLLGVFGGR